MSNTRARIGQPANLHQRNEAGVIEVRKALTERGFVQGAYERPFQVYNSTQHRAKIIVKVSPATGECYIECENCTPQRYGSSELTTAASIIKQTEYNN